jgi:hypothetical protein
MQTRADRLLDLQLTPLSIHCRQEELVRVAVCNESDKVGILQASEIPRLLPRVDIGSQLVDAAGFSPGHELRPRFRFSGVRRSFFGDLITRIVPTFPFACRFA